MIILGVESSCDETAISLVRDGHEVLANAISSQIADHAAYGGVVPELAAREHLTNVRPTLDQALAEAQLELKDIDGVAVTAQPGLLPALLVGAGFANGLALALNKPVSGINHLAAHIYGGLIERQDILSNKDAFPIASLLISGGNTQIFIIHHDGRCELVGYTLDDAAGEAYDKAAKILQLPYPGGPIIDRLAADGNPKAYDFPRAFMPGSRKYTKENQFNFSFSGLKTSLLNFVKKNWHGEEVPEADLPDLLASYQSAIVDVLCAKLGKAADRYKAQTMLICGGVACNSAIRNHMTIAANQRGLDLVLTPGKYCTDNAAMIAGLGYHYLKNASGELKFVEASGQAPAITHLPIFNQASS
jgi:N6-L-threonylcarbamoyladenine synthase